MSTQPQIPLELYKANLLLALRIAKLQKERGRRWLDSFEQAVGESVFESQQEIDKVAAGHDWSSLMPLPGETFLRLMQQGVGVARTVAEVAVTNQTRFLAGLQDGFLLWQREAGKALGGAGGARPFNTMLNDFFRTFDNATTLEAGHEH